MNGADLDRTDQGILYLLQEDARNNTTSEIGDRVGVSASTVSTRIRRLEERGIISGYLPTVDYRAAGLGHHLLVIATVPYGRRSSTAEDILEAPGVVSVRELLHGRQNVAIELVAGSPQGTERSLDAINDLDVELARLEMIDRELNRPFGHFGRRIAEDG